jgi:hypothetical protein
VHQHCRWITPLLGGLLLARASFGASPTSSVVFVDPSSDELDRSLRDALTAQLSGGPVTLVFEHFTQGSATLGRRMSEARALAESHHARGVFWIDTQADGDWLLYLAEPSGERTLVRRIEVEANGTDAGVEAVAVITRQSSEALMSGGVIGMAEVPRDTRPPRVAPPTPPVEPQTPPAPPAPRARPSHPNFHGLSLATAYAGDFPADAIGWNSGLALSAAYHLSFGLYVAAGYTFIRDTQLDASPILLRITRNPFYAEAGYSFGHGPIVFSLGGRVLIELLGRHAVSTSGSFSGTPDSTRTTVYLSPRARIDFGLSPALALYGALGADFGLNRFSFVSRVDGGDRVLLEPNVVRPAVEVGLSFWP